MNTNFNDQAGGDDDVTFAPIVESKDDKGADTTDYKAEALRLQGLAKRATTKLSKATVAPAAKTGDAAPAAKTGTEGKPAEGDFDRIDLAVLRVEKITDPKELELVREFKKNTGKGIDDILASKYFQAELKDMRDISATESATPAGTKRSGTSTQDTVEYWIANGKLPPPEQVELRRKVVNARMTKAKSGSVFSDNPIV